MDRQRRPKPAFDAVVDVLRKREMRTAAWRPRYGAAWSRGRSPPLPSWPQRSPRPHRGWLGKRLHRRPALNLWYRAPASDHPLLPPDAPRQSRQAGTAEWVRALPVGNGRLGAMVFGGIVHERLQLNEDTLWAGRP